MRHITPLLEKEKRNVFVCIGIVGNKEDVFYKDQIAMAIDKNGIQALGRKFYPTKKETKVQIKSREQRVIYLRKTIIHVFLP